MKNCSIVIGSLWGDEGKGHMTDVLCNKPSTLNVRFNGGAQASHTVVTPDGKRHAFRHFGSGTFAGAATYLSKQFIVNMTALVFESNELFEQFGITPTVFVNPECIVTTPWDVYINQGLETIRGDNRHGSCGFGINETVERSKDERYRITVYDLLVDEQALVNKLMAIHNEYVPARLANEYGICVADMPDKYNELLTDLENVDMFLFFKDEFLKRVKVLGNCVLKRYDNVVFEGAQGLLLDQNNEAYFPHVTTSNTGIKNVMDILQETNSKCSVDIYYMSRCYITRHGAGPLNNEIFGKPYRAVIDLTNVPNEFQGSLRFSYLDLDILTHEIVKDLQNLTSPANVNVVLTCVDQLGEEFRYVESGLQKCVRKNKLCDVVWEILSARISGLKTIYATNGLTRDNFISLKEM